MANIERPSRRGFLITGAVAASGLVTAQSTFAQQPSLKPTPACGDAPTVRQTEGPFFKPRSPERSDLIVSGSKGKPIELTGRVLTRSCKPVPRALVDLWHADEAGDYDNRGFRYRGHQFTDADGRYRFRTVVPAVYSGRTRHFHVKVQGANRPVLTTQLYFPDEAENRRDSMFRRELLMTVANAGDGLSATFDFVLDIG
jgi:protocatechuate 3,4-dioxygenase beta subunit